MTLSEDWIIGFAWGVGAYIKETYEYFLIRHHDKNLLTEITRIIATEANPQSRKSGYALRINSRNPLIKRMFELGWSSRTDKARQYPEGEMNQVEFISGYCYSKAAFTPLTNKNHGKIGILRIEGAEGVLRGIDDYIVLAFGTIPKKIRRRTRPSIIPTAPEYYTFVLSYQSRHEIPHIMNAFSIPKEKIRERMYQA